MSSAGRTPAAPPERVVAILPDRPGPAATPLEPALTFEHSPPGGRRLCWIASPGSPSCHIPYACTSRLQAHQIACLPIQAPPPRLTEPALPASQPIFCCIPVARPLPPPTPINSVPRRARCQCPCPLSIRLYTAFCWLCPSFWTTICSQNKIHACTQPQPPASDALNTLAQHCAPLTAPSVSACCGGHGRAGARQGS